MKRGPIAPILIIGAPKPPADSWWAVPDLPRALTQFVEDEGHVARMRSSKASLLVPGVAKEHASTATKSVVTTDPFWLQRGQ